MGRWKNIATMLTTTIAFVCLVGACVTTFIGCWLKFKAVSDRWLLVGVTLLLVCAAISLFFGDDDSELEKAKKELLANYREAFATITTGYDSNIRYNQRIKDYEKIAKILGIDEPTLLDIRLDVRSDN